jgi:hypothetical protein
MESVSQKASEKVATKGVMLIGSNVLRIMGMAADSIHSAGASSGELTKQQENHDQLA